MAHAIGLFERWNIFTYLPSRCKRSLNSVPESWHSFNFPRCCNFFDSRYAFLALKYISMGFPMCVTRKIIRMYNLSGWPSLTAVPVWDHLWPRRATFFPPRMDHFFSVDHLFSTLYRNWGPPEIFDWWTHRVKGKDTSFAFPTPSFTFTRTPDQGTMIS